MQPRPENKPSIYEKWNVQPPTVDNHGTEKDIERQFDEQRNRGHLWIKQGSIVKCTSCPFEHSFAVSTDVQLLGTDKDGMPMLDKIKIDVDK